MRAGGRLNGKQPGDLGLEGEEALGGVRPKGGIPATPHRHHAQPGGVEARQQRRQHIGIGADRRIRHDDLARAGLVGHSDQRVCVERGQLLLSDPISRWLPEYANQQVATANGLEPVQQAATVQDLLRHTAGLTYEFLGNSSVQQQYGQVKIASRERTNAEFCQTLAAVPLQFQPGSVWAYSRATDVLGRLVEVVSGQSLGAFLQAEIFGPLGMVDTGFAVPPDQQHRIAEPFAHDPDGGVPMKVLEPRQVPAMEGGGGGLMSTAMDYTRFLQCLRNRGELNGVRLLGPHTVDFMTSDHLGSLPSHGTLLPPGHGFGLGFAVRTHLGMAPVPGSVGLYYWGGIAGTTFFVDPTLDLYAMLMIQAPNQRDYYRPLFRDLVYAALL